MSTPPPGRQHALPADVRLRLGHAAVQDIADAAGVDIVHLKGHSVDPDLYPPHRVSSDVDVMVRPGQEERLIAALEQHGWVTETTFESGSLFHHAMTMRDVRFGHVDLHRLFPGLTADPAEVFEGLHRGSSRRPICAIPCTVPSRVDQATIILLHSARDGSRGPQDSAHLRATLTEGEWEAVVARASGWGAGGALAAALGELDAWEDAPDHALWRHMSEGGSRWDLFTARWRALPDLRSRLGLVTSVMIPNPDHLAISLGHRPTRRDLARDVLRRSRDAARGLLRTVRRRGGRDAR